MSSMNSRNIASGVNTTHQLSSAPLMRAKNASTGSAYRNSTNFDATVRRTQISRGRFVDRTSLESLDSAFIDDRSTALAHCQGSMPHSRKTMYGSEPTCRVISLVKTNQ